MEMKNRRFTVVELAGYIGEQDITSFDEIRNAWDYIESHYSKEERDSFHPDSLHIDIRQDWTDENGEEHGEYVY